MTEKRPISILLMDDEINSLVIQATIQHLNNQGFDVDFRPHHERSHRSLLSALLRCIHSGY